MEVLRGMLPEAVALLEERVGGWLPGYRGEPSSSVCWGGVGVGRWVGGWRLSMGHWSAWRVHHIACQPRALWSGWTGLKTLETQDVPTREEEEGRVCVRKGMWRWFWGGMALLCCVAFGCGCCCGLRLWWIDGETLQKRAAAGRGSSVPVVVVVVVWGGCWWMSTRGGRNGSVTGCFRYCKRRREKEVGVWVGGWMERKAQAIVFRVLQITLPRHTPPNHDEIGPGSAGRPALGALPPIQSPHHTTRRTQSSESP